jgi:hypothetical protein
MFNFGEFLSTIVILNGEFLLKKAAIYGVKKSFWSGISQINKNTYL